MSRHRVITSKPIPVKLDEELLKRIEEMSVRMGEAKSTVMRIAMRLGLDGLEKTFSDPPLPERGPIPSPPSTGDTLRKVARMVRKTHGRESGAPPQK